MGCCILAHCRTTHFIVGSSLDRRDYSHSLWTWPEVRIVNCHNCFLRTNSSTRDWGDNVVGRTLEQYLCAPEIDVVFTWVNGSDPRFIACTFLCWLLDCLLTEFDKFHNCIDPLIDSPQ